MTSNIARSISMKLSAISKQRNTPYKNVLTEFFLERLLARLISVQELSSALVFKGGYVGRRAYGSPRYTIDLDALLEGHAVSELRATIIAAGEKDIGDGAWYHFEETLDLQTQGEYPGVRFIFRAGLGQRSTDIKIAQKVHFDVGVGDFVDPVKASLQPLLEIKELGWSVYPQEVIVAEKLHSCLSRPDGNSRSKDIFDLLYHLKTCDPNKLKTSVQKTFEARGERVPQDLVSQFSKLQTTTLKKGWASAVSGLSEVGSFEEVFTEILISLESLFSI